MKKIIVLLLLATLFVACEKEGEVSNFDYDIKELYGTWDVTDLRLSNGSYMDLTSRDFPVDSYVTISEGGYRMVGFIGNHAGEYVADGTALSLLENGVDVAIYDILNMVGGRAEVEITSIPDMSVMGIKLKRR